MDCHCLTRRYICNFAVSLTFASCDDDMDIRAILYLHGRNYARAEQSIKGTDR